MRPANFLRALVAAIAALAWALSHAESVPNTLPEAFAALDKLLPASERTLFKRAPEREAVARSHMGLGTHMRNRWFRSGGSALPESLGAQHLDDASSIVLTSYWRHLNGKPLEVERQVDCYRRWVEQQRLINVAKVNGSASYATPAFTCPEG
jgi:hypothetical protein